MLFNNTQKIHEVTRYNRYNSSRILISFNWFAQVVM